MDPQPSAESGAGTEYRVMWWSERFQAWFDHTAQPTTKPEIAAYWLVQAKARGGRSGPTEARIEKRAVGPWTTVTSPEQRNPT